MKSARYIVIAAFFTLGVFSLALYSSCKKNNCGSLNCGNGGVCTEGKCVCPTGYSGNSCQSGWSDAVVGTYNCVRTACHPIVGGDSTWQSAVVKSSTYGGYTINISNFDKSNITVTGTIDSTINGQAAIHIGTATGTAGLQASGFFYTASRTIQLTFTSSSVGGVGGYTCTMNMTKL